MIYTILVVTGLAFGSFINALVWRIYKQDFAQPSKKLKVRKAHKAKPLSAKNLSILRGRSMCVHCHHTLAWYDLIPVFSWLSLGGKCRYCQKPVHAQYPLVELLTSALFVVSYIWWPLGFGAVGWLLFCLWLICAVILVALAVFDAKWQFLPDRLVFPLIAVATVFAGIKLLYQADIFMAAAGLIISVIIAGGLFYGLFVVSRGKLIGGGDGKLGVALGLLLGTPGLALTMLFIASLLGSLASLPSFLQDRSKNRVAFGPFLIIATFVSLFFGQSIIDWYLSTVGLY